MPSFQIDFETKCGVCRNELSRTEKNTRGQDWLEIEPCETCLDAKYQEGDKDGFERGKEENDG